MILCTHSPSSRKVKLEGFPRKSQLLFAGRNRTDVLCSNVQAIHVFGLRILHQALFTRVRACVLLLSVFYVLTIITGESVKLLLINSLHSNAMRFSYALKCGFKVLLLLVFVISGSEKRSYHYTRVKITSHFTCKT